MAIITYLIAHSDMYVLLPWSLSIAWGLQSNSVQLSEDSDNYICRPKSRPNYKKMLVGNPNFVGDNSAQLQCDHCRYYNAMTQLQERLVGSLTYWSLRPSFKKGRVGGLIHWPLQWQIAVGTNITFHGGQCFVATSRICSNKKKCLLQNAAQKTNR